MKSMAQSSLAKKKEMKKKKKKKGKESTRTVQGKEMDEEALFTRSKCHFIPVKPTTHDPVRR